MYVNVTFFYIHLYKQQVSLIGRSAAIIRAIALGDIASRDRGRPVPAGLAAKARHIAYVAGFNPNAPSIARAYDYFNGGRDSFAADRELAQHLVDIFPPIPVTVRENREFLDRTVTCPAPASPPPVCAAVPARGLPCDR